MKIQTGFTLVELMATLVIGIIILAIGVPAYISMVSTNQASGYARDLVSTLALARSNAIGDASSTVVCASNADQTDCSGNNWQNGWIAFYDDDDSSTLDAGEEVFWVTAIPVNERSDVTFAASSPNAIRFIFNGANSTDAQIQFSFQKDDCFGQQARQITVSRIGRASVEHVACL